LSCQGHLVGKSTDFARHAVSATTVKEG
jgi:hypothetical protein